MPNLLLLLFISLLWSGQIMAVDSVKVLALFPQKAMLSIDGKNKVLSDGQTWKGVQLHKATPHEAILEWDGRQRTLQLGTAINSSYQVAKKTEVRILRDNSGSYSTSGSINGRRVTFLIDTGANVLAMSETKAQQLGIKYKHTLPSVRVQSASGITSGYLVTLDKVKVGGIEELNVKCIIIKGKNPPMVLLGMSFLNRVDIDNQHNVMVLRKKY